MKKKLLILAGMLIFFQFGFSLSCAQISYYYDVKDGKVNYIVGNQELPVSKADAGTFKKLDNFFGMDINHVYYQDKIISNIDIKTFEVLEWSNPKSDPIWGTGCKSAYISHFKDKNGVYSLEDIQNGKLKLEK